jgi:hypothetical protein
MQDNELYIIIIVVLVSSVVTTAITTMIYQILKSKRSNRAPPPRPMTSSPPWELIDVSRRSWTPPPHGDYARTVSPVSCLGDQEAVYPDPKIKEEAFVGKVGLQAFLREDHDIDWRRIYECIELDKVLRAEAIREEKGGTGDLEFEARVDRVNGSKRGLS